MRPLHPFDERSSRLLSAAFVLPYARTLIRTKAVEGFVGVDRPMAQAPRSDVYGRFRQSRHTM